MATEQQKKTAVLIFNLKLLRHIQGRQVLRLTQKEEQVGRRNCLHLNRLQSSCQIRRTATEWRLALIRLRLELQKMTFECDKDCAKLAKRKTLGVFSRRVEELDLVT